MSKEPYECRKCGHIYDPESFHCENCEFNPENKEIEDDEDDLDESICLEFTSPVIHKAIDGIFDLFCEDD